MRVELPEFLSFKSSSDLIRIGRDNDGGYLVSSADIAQSDALLGLGVSDDWSFEEHFKKINPVPLLAYDASIGEIVFLKKFFKSLVKFNKPKIAFHWLKVWKSYRSFWSEIGNCHVKKFVGLNSGDSIHCTFNDALSNFESRNIFVKIDIEGSEYRFLESLVENQDRMTGLVIELHDCDIHKKAIKDFVSNFNLRLIHVHANNYAPVNLDKGMPLVLELTFSRYSLDDEEPELPHKFDMPNRKSAAEIELTLPQ